MAPKYKISYFPIKGRGELLRMILSVAGVEFEDDRVTNWSEVKQDKSRFPQNQMPVMEIDGKVHCQAPALSRYLANELGLYGDSSLDKLAIDQICETLNDMFVETAALIYGPDSPEKKKEKLKEIFDSDKMKSKFSYIQNVLLSNKEGKGYFIGEKISLADIHFFMAYDNITGVYPELLNEYKHLKSLCDRVSNHDNLKPYLASRPKTTN